MWFSGNVEIFDQSQKASSLFVVQLALYTERNHNVSLLYVIFWVLEYFDQSQKACCWFVVQLALYNGRNKVSLLHVVLWECGNL